MVEPVVSVHCTYAKVIYQRPTTLERSGTDHVLCSYLVHQIHLKLEYHAVRTCLLYVADYPHALLESLLDFLCHDRRSRFRRILIIR